MGSLDLHKHGVLYHIILSTIGVLLLSTYMVRTILPYLASSLGASWLGISRVLYIGFLTIPVAAILTGWLCDKYRSYRILSIASILTGFTVVLYITALNIPELIGIRFLHALFTDIALATGLAIAAEASSRGYIGIGFLRMVEGFGIAFGPILAWILSLYSYSYVIIAATIFAVTPILSMYLGKDLKESRSKSKIDILTALSVLKNLRIISLSIIALAENIGFIIILSYYISYLVTRLGFTEAEYAILLVVESLSFSISSYFSEKIYRSRGRSSILASTIVALIVYILLYSFNFKPLIIILMIPLGIASSFMFNPVYVEVSVRADESRRGLIINSLDFIIDLVFLVSPLLEPLAIFIGLKGLLLIPVVIALPALIMYLHS